jgi:hypothetical protein
MQLLSLCSPTNTCSLPDAPLPTIIYVFDQPKKPVGVSVCLFFLTSSSASMLSLDLNASDMEINT